MKKLLFTLLLALPFISFSQAQKKSNVILVSTSDAEPEALKKIGRILLNNGFVLETVDKDFYILVTKMKTCKYGMGKIANVDVKISVQIDKKEDLSILTITGKYNTPDLISYTIEEFDSKSSPIECCGPKSSLAGASWLIMDGVATKYENGEISYLTK
ncbi:hypothetical protein [Mangrovibacterium sp.]|uniref:hypothetical protein n=1 Tax=Mangrovibacterium sp. TaxID=1961364 RepID=UPI0035658089